MNRLTKELRERGLIYDVDYTSYYAQYESESILVGVANDIIITCAYCNVLEPIYRLYDRNFNFIAEQSSERIECFLGHKRTNPWSVMM